MKTSEIKDLTNEELQARFEESTRELFNLRIQQTTGQLENPLRVRSVRREIARIKTIMNHREKKGAAA